MNSGTNLGIARLIAITLSAITLGLGVCGLPDSARASTREAQAYSMMFIGTRLVDDQQHSAPSGEVEADALTSIDTTYSHARAFAGFKRCGAFCQGEKHINEVAALYATAIGTTGEMLTFSTRDLPPGAPVTIHAQVWSQGSVSGNSPCAVGDGSYEAFGSFYISPDDGANAITIDGGWSDNIPETRNYDFVNGTSTVDIQWQNGATKHLTMVASCDADMGALADCETEGLSDLLNSFRWMGVVSATDGTGNPIAEYTLTDELGNDWTTPQSAADITSDGHVNVADLLAVINAWGACPQPCPPSCAADIAPAGGDCIVNAADLLMVINNWGG